MLTLTVGAADGRSYCAFASIADAIGYLIEKPCGKPLRWQDGYLLHTEHNRGSRALRICWQHPGQQWDSIELTLSERGKITKALDDYAAKCAAYRWNYREPGKYLQPIRKGFEHCKAGGRVSIRWSDGGMSLAEYRRDFVRAMHRRINGKTGQLPGWRKLEPEYQTSLVRDSRAIRDRLTRRIRMQRLETPEARQRFGHLIDND